MSTTPTARTTVKLASRARYDSDQIYSILDEAYFAHVGFIHDDTPFVMPMLHARVDNMLYLHGGPASRIMRTLKKGGEICVTVTLLDGLVLARSAFHHSANYRSVVVLGEPSSVDDLEDRRTVLNAYTDKLVPARRPFLREMSEKEVRGTTVLRLALDEASAKVREGGPIDDEEDMELGIWAGVVPLRLVAGEPIADEAMEPEIARPSHVDEIAK